VSKTKPEFFGKYLLLEKIASGGMAEVFMARAPGAGGIGKIISMKRILPQYSDNQDFLDMFKSEAKIAINLTHSNVVSINEFGIEKEQLYLTMEYVEGKNLRQLLNNLKKKKKKLSIDQIVYIIKEVAAGLDHAHKCIDGSTGKPLNIIHRDMSPQNVMASFEGEVKIVDFGIAKAESQIEKTKAGTLKGKFGYMSPEQAQGLEVDIRTDIFSLGIILWEMLAGERLFIANNEINTLRKIRDCNVPSIKKINPNIHPELERIVNKSLLKDRNLRYQYANELYRDLNRFLNRQYPDFTKQDFSMFLSGIYAGEIVDIRNRIVEYSQIPFKDEAKTEEEKSDFLELITSTSAIPVDDKTRATASTPGVFDQSSSGTGSKRNFDFSKARLKSDNPFHKTKYKTKSSVKSSVNTNYRTHARPVKRGPNIVRFLTIAAIFSAMFFGYKSGLVGLLFEKQQQFTQNLIEQKNKADEELENAGSNSLASNTDEDATLHPAEPVAPVASAKVKIVVNSKPSGAKIFIDGKDTGRITPSQISVPFNEPIDLVLRKHNYLDYSKKKISITPQSTRSFNTTLQKASIGYVNIDARPSKYVKIYLNGKEMVENKLPIRNYAVRSGTTLTFKATNPYKKITRYKKVSLKAGESKSIVFDLDSQRVPTSQNRHKK